MASNWREGGEADLADSGPVAEDLADLARGLLRVCLRKLFSSSILHQIEPRLKAGEGLTLVDACLACTKDMRSPGGFPFQK